MSKFNTLLLCLILFTGAKLSAQITITQTDVQNFISIGSTTIVNIDTTTTSVDIGMPGATSWDFSGLLSDYQSEYSSIDPAGTPFASLYPMATACFNGLTNIMGYELESWQYLGIDNNALLSYGNAAQGNIGSFNVTALIIFNPSDEQIIIPLTMGNSWAEDYVETDSTIISPLPPIITVYTIHEENTVDAYGTMTLPGSGTTEALRIRTHKTENDNGTIINYVSYLFLSKSGTQISVEAADTTSPNSGVIPVSGITYISSNPVPVELISFSAFVEGNQVNLRWETATETNNKGFEIYKNQRPAGGEVPPEGGSEVKSQKWEKIGFVGGNGTTTERHLYGFKDSDVNPGKYIYRLKQIDFDGSYEYSNEIEADIIESPEFSLKQNYPNPFNPTTQITYTIPSSQKVVLKVFNALGQNVVTLVNNDQAAGTYTVDFDASELASGIYYYRLQATSEGGQAGDFVQIKKMILMK